MTRKLLEKLKGINKENIKKFMLNIVPNMKIFINESWPVIKRLGSFSFLLFAYILMMVIDWLNKLKYTPLIFKNKIYPFFNKIYKKIVAANRYSEKSINRVSLIDLSLGNMKYKATRTLITVGGMSVGIAAIVFLVSLGYGLQKMVIARVARLDEMKQADVYLHPGSSIDMNDETVAKIQDVQHIELVLPMIASVGKINYKGSVIDTAVFGVTRDYLSHSAIKPIEGKIFDSNKTSRVVSKEVAGLSDVRDNKIYLAEFSIDPTGWIEVRKEPNYTSEIIGYTKRAEGTQQGILENIEDVSWIKTKVFLWEHKFCDKDDIYCFDESFYVMRDGDGYQIQENGYILEKDVYINTVIDTTIGNVLGTTNVLAESDEITESTSSAGLNIQSTDDEGWVQLIDETTESTASAVIKVDPPHRDETRKALVNMALLKVLGIERNNSIGQKFEVSFIITGDLLETLDEKIESTPVEYEIVGVVSEDSTPFFYVPLIDLKELGVTKYSQLKMVVDKKTNLADAREHIEAMGFVTQSVVDTVEQINQLFNTLRIVLALVGTVALAVASLGMFNTLTVSLLERTREIGLMKAMGMKSFEVQELFLTESMLMGIFGGLSGIVFGFIAGKALTVLLSIVSVTKGVGIIDIVHLPFTFVVLIMFLSLVVGLITGIYPAKRATKISALNALRYE